ncbi:hypothetical protein BDW68DRAFT_58461 [Aspergillus falconensis]
METKKRGENGMRIALLCVMLFCGNRFNLSSSPRSLFVRSALPGSTEICRDSTVFSSLYSLPVKLRNRHRMPVRYLTGACTEHDKGWGHVLYSDPCPSICPGATHSQPPPPFTAAEDFQPANHRPEPLLLDAGAVILISRGLNDLIYNKPKGNRYGQPG